jgi:dCMP deaminase
MPAGWSNECEFTNENNDIETKLEVVHAEANAIIKLARDGESGKDATLFVTHAPCIHCAKMIYGAGISKVYYKYVYRDEWGVRFLENCDIDVEVI